MNEYLPSLPTLVRDTFRDPRATARRILALQLPERVLWEALALGVLLTVVLLVGLVLAATQDTTDPTGEMLREVYGRPLFVAVGQAINSVITVFAVYRIGRLFGGIGDRAGAVALVAWHQFVMLVAGVAVIALAIFLPSPLISVLLIAMIGFYFFLLTQFICALHGFDNGVPVFAMMILSMLAIYLLISVVTGLLAAIFLGGPPHV